jgi:hypothetical protein
MAKAAKPTEVTQAKAAQVKHWAKVARVQKVPKAAKVSTCLFVVLGKQAGLDVPGKRL